MILIFIRIQIRLLSPPPPQKKKICVNSRDTQRCSDLCSPHLCKGFGLFRQCTNRIQLAGGHCRLSEAPGRKEMHQEKKPSSIYVQNRAFSPRTCCSAQTKLNISSNSLLVRIFFRQSLCGDFMCVRFLASGIRCKQSIGRIHLQSLSKRWLGKKSDKAMKIHGGSVKCVLLILPHILVRLLFRYIRYWECCACCLVRARKFIPHVIFFSGETRSGCSSS